MKSVDVKFVFLMLCFSDFVTSTTAEVADGIYLRSVKGEYDVSSIVNANVVGSGLVDLLVCVPYPVSNLYQDVIWKTSIDSSMLGTYPETGEKYIKYAKKACDQGKIDIERSFLARIYKVTVDFSKIGEIYEYDVGSDLYQRYTRQPPADGNDNLWVDTNNTWIVENVAAMKRRGLNALEFARAAYELVATNFTYKIGWQKTITDIINARSGDCGQLSSVFVSILRAAGIPARCVVCMRPNSSCHVWAEFYLERYGWIPTDVDYEVENGTRFDRFGVYDDSCIVMTFDTHLSSSMAGGSVARACLIQSYAYWWWRWDDSTTVSTDFSMRGDAGCIRGGTIVPESWLFEYYGYGLHSYLSMMADADTDGDGYSSWQEYIAGSNPTNMASRLVSDIVMTNGAPYLTWKPNLGDKRTYKVWGSDNLNDWAWPTNALHNFFRVTVEMP